MRIILIISLFTIFFSCKKTDVDHVDFGYNYFPITMGHFIDYEVKEYLYEDVGVFDSNVYQLREVIDSSFIDQKGKTIYRQNRMTRSNDTLPWKTIEYRSFIRDIERLELNEGNIVFVKMRYPIRRGARWNGNALNHLPEETYEVINLDLKAEISDTTFNKTLRINQLTNINLIEEQFKEEVYAKDIGLVYFINMDIELSTGEIKSGVQYTQVYLGHGIL